MDAATLPARRIIRAHDGHTTGPTGTGTRRAATGLRRTHCTGAQTDTRRQRPLAREEHKPRAPGPPRARQRPGTTTSQAPMGERIAAGTRASAGRARHRRPEGNASPRAPGPTRDEHATGAQRGTHRLGHPGRYRTSIPQVHVNPSLTHGGQASEQRARRGLERITSRG
jgi:hypothetical protein